MAHFAEIDSDNKVLRVLVVDNEQEHRGQEFLANDLGLGGTWVQTSYNANIRKHFAGIGYLYSQELDAFIAPQPYNSWVLDEDTCKWQAPTPMPVIEGKSYYWSEDDLSWMEITVEITNE
jgi:hypothetical protein